MTAEPLTCKEFVELVTEYLEGKLPPAERQRFEEHMAVCPGCDIYLQQMRQTVSLAGRLTEEALDAEAQARLLAAFRRWKTGRA